MASTLKNFIDKSIEVSFLAPAIATPFIFTTQTTEIFEVPKMYFVYFLSVIILFLTVIKSALRRKLNIPMGPVPLLFAAFIAVQTISTIFSRDLFLSVFGYPTRLNGSLLSQLAYFVIFTTALAHLNVQRAQKLLLAIVISAFAVSIWGIPSHFGKDPSCLILTGNLTSSCWQKDFDPTL